MTIDLPFVSHFSSSTGSRWTSLKSHARYTVALILPRHADAVLVQLSIHGDGVKGRWAFSSNRRAYELPREVVRRRNDRFRRSDETQKLPVCSLCCIDSHVVVIRALRLSCTDPLFLLSSRLAKMRLK